MERDNLIELRRYHINKKMSSYPFAQVNQAFLDLSE